MLYPPSHLKTIVHQDLDQTTDSLFVGHLACPCGEIDLRLLHSGDVREVGGALWPVAAEIDGHYFMIVGCECRSCQETHLVFDKDYHGWNGFACAHETGDRLHKRPELAEWQCLDCGSSVHKVTVRISMDKEMILEDGPVNAPDGSTLLDEDNWFEGFDWIIIDIECSQCGRSTPNWISFETM